MAQGQRETRFDSSGGRPLVLVDMRVSGVLRHDFAIVEMVQTYRNDEAVNIEATYSFPLPLRATLLQLSARLGDRTLLGRVTARAKAEAQYEAALDEGHSAVMLEELEPGLYTMNVGNLLAGETAEVAMRFALPLVWQGRQLRLALPTTVAPRYGNPADAGVQPHQLPQPDLLTEHAYSLALRIEGELARADVASPSHALRVRSTGDAIELGLHGGHALADRDFVLTLVAPAQPASTLIVVPDGNACVAHVAFRIPEREPTAKLALKILVDCSGSMAGDSIALAKAGVLSALDALEPADAYAVSAFGSHVKHASAAKEGLALASARHTHESARRFVQCLDADLGGTEMLRALESAFQLKPASDGMPPEGGDVLLITDGEVWDRVAIVHACRQSGHRVFVVGIGASPNQALVEEVAQATGGAAAFVSPGEDIAAVVQRHLRRMRVPRVVGAQLEVPGSLAWQSPARLDRATFAGDTLHVFCGLSAVREGCVRLALRYADGGTELIAANVAHRPTDSVDAADWPRIAASHRIHEAILERGVGESPELGERAIHYQVVSPYTNYILVHLRGENAAADAPELRQVPNMLAAGWGGVGSVGGGGRKFFETRVVHYMAASPLSWDDDAPTAAESGATPAIRFSLQRDPAPSFDDSQALDIVRSARRHAVPLELIDALNPTFTLINPERRLARTLAEPNGLIGTPVLVDNDVIDGLQALIELGWREEQVLIAFWLALLSLPASAMFSRSHRRGILRAARQTPVPGELVQWFEQALAATTGATWSWVPVGDMPQPLATTSEAQALAHAP